MDRPENCLYFWSYPEDDEDQQNLEWSNTRNSWHRRPNL